MDLDRHHQSEPQFARSGRRAGRSLWLQFWSFAGRLSGRVQMLHDFVMGELLDLSRSTRFLTRGTLDQLVVLGGNVPIRASIDVGHGIVSQPVSGDLFAGFIEDLDKFAGEI